MEFKITPNNKRIKPRNIAFQPEIVNERPLTEIKLKEKYISKKIKQNPGLSKELKELLVENLEQSQLSDILGSMEDLEQEVDKAIWNHKLSINLKTCEEIWDELQKNHSHIQLLPLTDILVDPRCKLIQNNITLGKSKKDNWDEGFCIERIKEYEIILQNHQTALDKFYDDAYHQVEPRFKTLIHIHGKENIGDFETFISEHWIKATEDEASASNALSNLKNKMTILEKDIEDLISSKRKLDATIHSSIEKVINLEAKIPGLVEQTFYEIIGIAKEEIQIVRNQVSGSRQETIRIRQEQDNIILVIVKEIEDYEIYIENYINYFNARLFVIQFLKSSGIAFDEANKIIEDIIPLKSMLKMRTDKEWKELLGKKQWNDRWFRISGRGKWHLVNKKLFQGKPSKNRLMKEVRKALKEIGKKNSEK